MKDINSLLILFANGDGYHQWCNSPFKIEDKVFATDRHAMIIIPADYAPEVQDLEDYDPASVLGIIPKNQDVIQSVSAKEILKALKAVPTVKEDKECDACKGDGEVEFEFIYDGGSYKIDEDCPLCDGEGSYPDENGKIIPDPSKSITIGKSSFAPKFIKKLYQLCQYFEFQDIDLVSQPGEMASSLFSKDGVSLLIMPVKDVESVYTIK